MRHLSSLNQFAQINLILVPKNKESQGLGKAIKDIEMKGTMNITLMSLKRVQFDSNNKKWIGF